MKLSIVIPAKNEAHSLEKLLPKVQREQPDAEIIVVNDGSSDHTATICNKYDVIELKNHYSRGNGAAIKQGVRRATGEFVVFMDGDGQHDPADISLLLEEMSDGFDMVVAAREFTSQASFGRGLANTFYNRLSSYMTGQTIQDLTSGFRAVKREKFMEFLYLLPNGFSYPTTSTMAFFRAGYSVAYVKIAVSKREGKSHIRPIKDGIRFLLIIFKIGTLYSPLKLFLPISVAIFLLGLGYYGYTFITASRFTNMSALLFTTSLMVFLVGLVSEQITTMMYKDTSNGD